jgi:hypothetical protein
LLPRPVKTAPNFKTPKKKQKKNKSLRKKLERVTCSIRTWCLLCTFQPLTGN